MGDSFLDKVYGPMDEGQTRDFYDTWADQYEADVAAAGYATPSRAAKALASALPDKSLPILDFGCGTGLSGAAFRAAGFTAVDGMDPSAEMLAVAAAKDIYRNLTQIEPGAALPTGYAAIAAVGVIGCGAAPVSVFDDVMAALSPGGLFVLSYNDHALAVPEYTAKLDSYTDTGAATLVSEDYGPHLPAHDGNTMSKVFVLRKT